MGAVMTPQDVMRSAAAGARFIASPHAAPDVVLGPELLGDALLPGGNLDSLAERAREVRAGAERGRNRAP